MIFLWLRQDFVTNKFTCSDLGSAVLFVYLPVLLFAPDNDIVLLRLFLIVHSNGQRVVRVCVCIWGGGGQRCFRGEFQDSLEHQNARLLKDVRFFCILTVEKYKFLLELRNVPPPFYKNPLLGEKCLKSHPKNIYPS